MSSDKKISELPMASSLDLDDTLPVVHANQTQQIKLRDLIAELQVNIPQPRIKIYRDIDKRNFGHDIVHAFWEGSDDKFLKYNPEFWLYRYKKAGLRGVSSGESSSVDDRYEWRPKRFVHPSHQHGTEYLTEAGKGLRYYSGEQMIRVGTDLVRIASRNTEWAVGAKPMAETVLDLSPWTYYRTSVSDPALGVEPDKFPMQEQPSVRGTASAYSRLCIFKVRIAIDNPDTKSEFPKLFGAFSETFICFPFRADKEYKGFKYYLGSEAAPRLR
jgi:hypothetical protein